MVKTNPIWFETCRYGLLVISTVFLLAGLGVIAGGIFLFVQGSSYGITAGVAGGTFAAGCVVTLLSILGIYGGASEHRCVLTTFQAIVLILLAGEVAMVIITYVKEDLIFTLASQSWDQASNTTREFVESNFGCCGFADPTDRAAGCSANSTTEITNSTTTIDGCLQAIQNLVATDIVYVRAVAFGLIAIQAVSLIFVTTLVFSELSTDNPDDLTLARDYNRQEMSDYA